MMLQKFEYRYLHENLRRYWKNNKLMAKFIIEEAKRCLNCKKSMCKEGCPVKTPTNEVIKMFLNGNIVECGEKLFENNPLSVVCSLVCPHENQCEGHCVLKKRKFSANKLNRKLYIRLLFEF